MGLGLILWSLMIAAPPPEGGASGPGRASTTRTPSRTLGGSTEGASATPSATALPTARPRAWLPTAPLKGGGDVTGLCDVLRSEDAVTFTGNEVARARARADHRRRRLEATGRNYVIDVPSSGFSFREYDLAERRLALDEDRSFRIAEGVELYSAEREAILDFELAPDSADGVLKDHAAGRLALRLVFRGGKSDMTQEPCLRMGGGRIAKMRVQVLAYDLVRRDGATVARGETPDFHDAAVAATPVGAPKVTVRRPSADGGEVPDDIAASAEAVAPSLLPCYQKALETSPGLRGTLVVGLRLMSDGRVEAPRMEVSSLGDEGAVSCVIGRLAKARLARPTGGALRLSVPIVFAAQND